MTNELKLELVGMARYQLEEFLQDFPKAGYSVVFNSTTADPEFFVSLGDPEVEDIRLVGRWENRLTHTISLSLREFSFSKLTDFFEELAGDAEIFPLLLVRDNENQLWELDLKSAAFIVSWDDQPEGEQPVEALDLEEEESWDDEVHHWAQELEAEASRTTDPVLRDELRRRTGLLLGVAEYAGRYEDLDH